MTTLPQTGFIRLPDVLRFIPVSEMTWRRWMDAGKAPKSIRLGPNSVAWRAEDIHALIAKISSQ